MRDSKVCRVEFEPETSGEAAVRDAYRAVADGNGRVHNLYKAMSLVPAAIAPADRLYRALMHDDACPLEPWLRELVAVHVAILCDSGYAVAHHGENFHDFYGDRERSEALLDQLRRGGWREEIADARLKAILSFNERLATAPESIAEEDIEALRRAGLSDREIVYLAQISASFAYWSRIINALGIVLGDERVGLAGKEQR